MKLNITKRLYIGFAFAILFIILIGITSYKTFTAQASEQDWINHTHEVINHLQEINVLVAQTRSAHRSFRITNDSNFLAIYADKSIRLSARLSNLQRMMSDDPAQFEKAGILRGYTSDFTEYLKSITQPIKIFTREEVVNVTRIEESKLGKIHSQLSEMTGDENKLLSERNERTQALLKAATSTLIVYMILTLMMVFILIYFTLRELIKRRKAEEEINANLKELENLNAVTNQKNWLLTGLTEINTSVPGESTISELCESILKRLQKYLDLPAGAFYAIIDGVPGLQLIASLGTVNSNKTFSEKHTLIANAFDSKCVVVLKDIPENYWYTESALGKAKAGEIAYVPLKQNEAIIGVIELGTFKTFPEEQINFLNVAADNIAIALQSAQSQRKIKNLLEQVGQQKDELMNQQEVLYKTNEELSQQAETLQKSEEELKVQGEELRKTNEELMERNAAIELARQTLLLKTKELEDASKYKSEFLANMSHELRTPLNSILILSRQLAENKNNNLTEKQTEYARIIHRSGSDLLDLINDMLDLSKIEAGKIELHIEEVKTENVEYDIKELFAEVAKEKEINFITQIQASVPEFIQTDKQRLEQILKNLLSNAFKFTPANGEVKMIFSVPDSDNLKSSGSRNKTKNKILSIAVIDTGIGIPVDKQELIFEAFQQVDGSTSRRYGGTGLGLSICRELINRLGGEMQLKSKEGEGSIFTIFLPIEAKMHSAEKEEIKEENKNVDELAAPLTSLTITDDRHSINVEDKVVLIIEDEVQFASLLRDFARNHNYKSIVALKGDEGFLYAKKYMPHAIILDIKLPVIDGWTLLKLLKDDEKLKHIPVHIITGTDCIGTAPGNVITYLKKPVGKQDLDNTFESLIENSLGRFKKLLLILSGDNLNKDSLTNLIKKRQLDIECTYVNDVEEGIQQLMKNDFDGVIADAGKELEKAKNDLKKLKENISKYNLPVIVFIDADISQTDELELRKLSDVVIRNAEQSKNRLMDEVELFLYKIQEEKSNEEHSFTTSEDKILHDKKVLLVDDDMRNVFVLSNILEENKMKVTAAVNGKDAIEELKKHPEINIILMDIMMPEMDGYQTMEKIRKELGFMNLPIIALTAKAMQGDKEKCLRAGASDYISKPLDINKLLSLMRIWLAQQK